MLRSLDTIGLRIIPNNVLGRVGKEAKEDSLTSVRAKLGCSSTRRPNPNTASKRSKAREVILFPCSQKKRGLLLISRRQDIVNSEPVVESVRPELDGQVGTKEHSTDGIGNSEMTTLNRSILVGGISSCWPNLIAKSEEQPTDLRVVI